MKQPDKAVSLKRLQGVLDRLPDLQRKGLGAIEFEKWHRDAQVAIGNTFGQDSEQLTEFLDKSSWLLDLVGRTTDSGPQDWYTRALSRLSMTIQSMIEEIAEYWEDEGADAQEAKRSTRGRRNRAPPQTRKVFIVHGRDAGTKEEVARFVEKLCIEPVILTEMPSKGKTVIEKFERYSDVGYAIVLLTADDCGALKGEELRPRARQNVIFELGFFVAKLGRECVCVLTRGGPEIPGDYAGVVYIPMDEGDSWKILLVIELNAAGVEMDTNGVFD